MARDVTERIERERELRETTNRFEAVIEAVPDGIVVLDEEGKVEYWNEAAERIFGWDAGAVIGEQPPVVPDEHRSSFDEGFAKALSGEAFNGKLVERRTKSGDTVSVRVSAAPIRDADGTITGAVAVVDDSAD